jgi:hypothetical protein
MSLFSKPFFQRDSSLSPVLPSSSHYYIPTPFPSNPLFYMTYVSFWVCSALLSLLFLFISFHNIMTCSSPAGSRKKNMTYCALPGVVVQLKDAMGSFPRTSTRDMTCKEEQNICMSEFCSIWREAFSFVALFFYPKCH